MLEKGLAHFLQVIQSKTEAAEISRLVRAVRVVWVEQIAGEFHVFDERFLCIGQPHAVIDKRAQKFRKGRTMRPDPGTADAEQCRSPSHFAKAGGKSASTRKRMPQAATKTG